MRRFAGLRLLGALPDETTILKLRHLLEKHGLGEALIEEINAHLALARTPVEDGDDRRREHPHRALVDEEPHRRAGPGDASRRGRASSGTSG